MKVQNFEIALRLLECGPGWKVLTFENQMKHEQVVRLMHIDGYAEEMALSHEELWDNPVGVMQMLTGWIRQRTKLVEVPVPTTTFIKAERPMTIPKPTSEGQALVDAAVRPVERTRPARAVRTRLITLED